MTAQADGSLSQVLEEFLAGRQSYAVDFGETNWSQLDDNHILPVPESVNREADQTAVEAWDSCQPGDVVIAYENTAGDDYFYGIGVVTETPIEKFCIDAVPYFSGDSGDYRSVLWTTIVSNGERLDQQPVESPPESQFAEVEEDYLLEVLISVEEERRDLTAIELLHQLIAADQLREVDTLLNQELPAGWDDEETEADHIRAVTLETLLGRNASNRIQRTREWNQKIIADRAGVAPETIEDECGAHLFGDTDGIEDPLEDGFDQALARIESHIRSFDRVSEQDGQPTEVTIEAESTDSPNLFLVPAGRTSDNLNRTVTNPVDKSTIRSHDPAIDLDDFDGDAIPIWGHQEEKSLQQGDIVLLYKQGEYQYAAEVVATTYNPALGEEIWIADDDETFEHIFYLQNKREIDLTAEQLNAVLDYQLNFVPNGFMSPAESGLELLREKFGSIQAFVDHIAVEETPELYTRIADQLEDTKQVVFHGPPGTGKTFHAKEFAEWWVHQHPETVQPNRQTRVITFHPSFSYEDFIEGLTTKSDGDTVTYEMEKGVLRNFVESMTLWDANETCDPEDFAEEPRYILIIDEINRGNIANILGELVTLLEADKRAGADNELSINLAHSDDEFSLPSNLYIIGTMNTADRSITLVDAAIRRRFGFISFPPDYDVLAEKFELDRSDLTTVAEKTDLDGLHAVSILALEAINTKIRDRGDLGKGKQLGHSYLLNTDSKNAVVRAWKYELLPLLEEYFFESFDEIAELLDAEHNYYLLDRTHEQIRHVFGDDATEISEAKALHTALAEVADIEP